MCNKIKCKKCFSPDIHEIESTALDKRPMFKCMSCGNTWFSGKSGEPYKSYCDNRNNKKH